MNSDLAIIKGLRDAQRFTAAEYARVYCECAGENSGENIRAVLDGHLRLAEKLAELEGLYKLTDDTKYAAKSDIIKFRESQENCDKA
ncbi:hypothetical protein [uncultured Ruminococcus sp.]|uniref:hypothetical protein n=1 Tax=uncultured Ruminococcus sp. TaxID=165186 RepID=UPI0025D00B36|nr:hypothetical protein [uncultured Ruminococcus sp.]